MGSQQLREYLLSLSIPVSVSLCLFLSPCFYLPVSISLPLSTLPIHNLTYLSPAFISSSFPLSYFLRPLYK